MKHSFKSIMANILVFVLMLSMFGQIIYGNTNDIAGHWAEKAMQKWISNDLLSGYEDGTIRPNQSIKRAEFFAMINRIFGFSERAAIPYTDVKQDSWYYGEIQKAQGAGYISGYLDQTIRPVQSIDRQEVAAILSRVFDIEESSSDEVLYKFNDEASISSWAKQAVATMVEQHYVNGYPDDTFKPKRAITRAEVISMLDNIIGEIVNTPGSYQTTAERNVVINQPGVTLHDTVIQGDLYLLEGIGEGDVILDNVTVLGETIIRGGGENSIHIKNSKLAKVIVNKKNGKVRVVAQGNSEVGNVQLKSGAKLEEELDENAQGFGTVETTIDIPEGATVEFVGEFDDVSIDTESIQVKVLAGSIKKMNVSSNIAVELNKKASIKALLVSAAVALDIKGKGTIEAIDLANKNAQIKDENNVIQPNKKANQEKTDNDSTRNNNNNDNDSTTDDNDDEDNNPREDATDIPVILYHRIVSNPSNEWTDTSIEEFKKQMKYLDDNGYTTLTARQYVDIMDGVMASGNIPEKPILLSFDDGTSGFKENALPILNQYNMNAVLFIVTDWIDNPGNLSKEDLQTFADLSNISLQNHTKNHDGNIWGTNGSERSEITKVDAENQIKTANEYLKNITGENPVLLAYPYGSYNNVVKQVNEENGIKYAFKVGYPNEERYVMGRHYITDQSLVEYANEIGGPTPPDESGDTPVTNIVTVYHETFADGLGVATQAGGAQLEAISDAIFDGNTDGKAIYVSRRTNNWDGVDIPFAAVGMENGKDYTITVRGYVYSDATVPEGAQVLLQNVDSYNGLYVSADLIAGEAFTLTSQYTVDTEKDRALRIQSNDAGATVPFCIGDILIIEEVADGGETEQPGEVDEDREPAIDFNAITFEDQDLAGFEGRGEIETLTVTDEANHTDGGSYALKVEGREKAWNGPALRVEKYIDKGYEYKITAWVKLISANSSQLQLSTQVGSGDGASYNNLQGKTVSTEDGWVQYEGTYRYSSVGDEYVTIYVESSNNADASFYIDDISFEKTSSGTVEVQKDLTPIKEVYKDDFLVGNIVSAKEFEGNRLELLTMHHDVVTAENAMKPSYAYGQYPEFDFDAEDALVSQVEEGGLKLHGHVLVWHQQSEESLHTDADGKSLDKETALSNLRTHVKTVVEHFGDKVISWDVVNEAMNDNPSNPSDWRASLRQSGWLSAIGPDYIKEAFLAAKEALGGKDVKLYYNDYNDDNQNKAEAIYQMVKEINDEYAAGHNGELLIDGIGMQSHYNLHTNPDNVEASLEKFISVTNEVSVTELDVTAGSNGELTEKQANEQAYLYAKLFKIYKEHADHIARVTFWGLNDTTSWRAEQCPLVFDADLQAKAAYYAVIDPDKFIEEYVPEEKVVREGTALYGTPTIDGAVDSIWNNVPELQINQYQMAWQGASGIAKALWDDENLYVLVNVSDAQLDKSSANAWEQDSIEVFLDQNNGKTASYEADDGQYRVNFDNETSFNPSGIAEGFESATKVDGTNYTVEVKIPLTSITPANDVQIGFDVQVNDGQDGARQSAATWNDLSGVGYQDTSVYGILTLKNNE